MNSLNFLTRTRRLELARVDCQDHDDNCICEECCTHDDTECGYCIDCGAYVVDNYDREPEINPDR